MRLLLCLAVLGLGFSDVEARIPRDQAQVRAFRSEHPCPATGRARGACPGWQVDHIVPLCAGGADHPSNMQWISREDHAWKTFIDTRECRKARRALSSVMP
ncbi:HNH endonuclease [Acidovorax sp. Root219]|nr:HNH endonuclease [Acidovorax sp. Root219]